MGVERNDYVFCGWKLDYEMQDVNGNEIDWWSGDFAKYEEDNDVGEFAIIADGMSGEYAVFGIKIQELDNEDGEGWEFVELEIKDTYKKKCIKEFKKLFKQEPETDPKFLIFSHYH